MVNSQEFSERLQLIMQKHELNASSFAEKIGVGRSSMSHILSGRNKPSLDFVLAVLKTFNDVDLYWLLNGRGSYPQKKTDEKERPSPKSQTNPLPSSQNNDAIVSNPSSAKKEKKPEQSPREFESSTMKKGKNITRVIIFYEDGTFENFIA